MTWDEPRDRRARTARAALHAPDRAPPAMDRAPPGASFSPRDVTALQRHAGNAAIARLLAPAATAQRCAGDPGCACGGHERDGVAVQRAKIDFADLTWADFKGPAPAKFPAATFSGMHPLAKPLKQASQTTDTGAPCTVGKKTSTEFEGERSLDPTALDHVKAYMWQEKSGAKADYKVGLKAATAATVKSCVKHFDAQAKKIAKQAKGECAAHVGPCKHAFAQGSDSFTLEFGDETVTVTDAAECSKALVTDCRAAFIKGNPPAEFTWSRGVKPTKACPGLPVATTAEATAAEKADCDATFKTEVAALNVAETDRLLAHEQLHFAITHTFATDLHDDLAARPATATATGCGDAGATSKAKAAFAKLKIDTSFAKAWKKAEKERNKTQTSYDKETCHGLDEDAQGGWDGKF